MAGLPFNPSGAPGAGGNLNLPFGYTGAPAGAGGIAGLNNLNIDTIARPNSYIGLNSFVSVASHYVAIPNQNGREDSHGVSDAKELGLGMLVFARDPQYIKPDVKEKPQYGVPIGNDKSKNTVELKELTQLNTYLAAHSHKYSKASEILAEWRLLGVIKTEAAPSSLSSQATPYGSAASSRIINLIVGHRVSLLNYWSNSRIVQTQKLYLIVNKNAAGHWCIIPWTSSDKSAPSLGDLVENGNVGDFIYVGKSSDQAYEHTSGNKKGFTSPEVVQSLVKRGLMNQLEIYIGI